MFSSEIDLRSHSHLRLLQFNLYLESEKVGKLRDDVICWFTSICESVMSKSLVVEVRGFSEKVEIYNKIEDTLLAMHERIGGFSVYFTPQTKAQGLFSKLYKAGIVVEDYITVNENKQVGSNIRTFFLLFPLTSYLASPIFPSVIF